MKKICGKLLVLIIVIVNCAGIISGCGASISNTTASNNVKIKDRLEAIKEKGVLTIASANDKPFAYIDPETNKLIGIDSDIITEAAKRLGINKVEMSLVPFKSIFNELNTDNNIDMIADGVYVTDERKKDILFTNALYKEPETILTLESSKINSKEDLKNAVIGVVIGTVFTELGENWKKDGLVKEVRLFQTQSDVILAAVLDEIDAAILDSVTASYLSSRYKNLHLKIFTPYKPELPGLVAAAVRKSDITLADAINKKIDEMKYDGKLMEIMKKYGLNESNFVSVEDGHISVY